MAKIVNLRAQILHSGSVIGENFLPLSIVELNSRREPGTKFSALSFKAESDLCQALMSTIRVLVSSDALGAPDKVKESLLANTRVWRTDIRLSWDGGDTWHDSVGLGIVSISSKSRGGSFIPQDLLARRWHNPVTRRDQASVLDIIRWSCRKNVAVAPADVKAEVDKAATKRVRKSSKKAAAQEELPIA